MNRDILSNSLHLRLGVFCIASTLLGLGCSGDTTGAAAVVAPSSLFWSVKLNYRAVNLALVPPYDTVRLSAIALDAAGNHMSNAGRVTFRTVDSTVTVDSTGLVTAHYRTSSISFPTSVVASYTLNGVTHADTALIQVVLATQTHVPLATFSIQPAAGDSAKMAFDYFKTITASATDSSGNVMRDESVNNLLVSFASSDEKVAIIDRKTGDLSAVNVGRITLYASTYAYGVAAQDSLPYVIGYPIGEEENAIDYCGDTTAGGPSTWFVDHFRPISKTVGVGAIVTIKNNGCDVAKPDGDTLDIIFDDATVVPGGILLIPEGRESFTINKEGVFHYHSAKYGGSGTIISSSGP